ncbi:hypothetical protein [Novosphingobium pokkalii]|uniref:Polymerase n=2 Tax=Novosphingobium pokkalii TaxID=1770194 RepID=A0ABV7V4F9_9SPHN|nr:hypothetical protein [Novosphingobium pokkalii]
MAYAAHPRMGISRRPVRRQKTRWLKKPVQSTQDMLGGIVLAAATLMNFALAILNAHGLGMNNAKVTVIQTAVTAAAAGLFYLRPTKMKPEFTWALVLILLSLVITSATQGFNAKCFYDMLIIPIFIAAGATLEQFPVKMLNRLTFIVLIVALIEILKPTLYTAIANPLNFLMNTRSWVADSVSGSAGNDLGLYQGAMRAGGSKFALTDHRVGSVFLEPISLGYFALIASIAYNEIYKFDKIKRAIMVGLCLFLSLAADSRIPTMLIIGSTAASFTFRRFSPKLIWVVPLLIFLLALGMYISGGSGLYSDMGERLSITFDVLKQALVSTLLIGGVSDAAFGDSGFLYLIRCVGLLGLPLALCTFAGMFSRGKKAPAFINIAAAGYMMVGALFGGAIFSIKTAGLLGMVIGYAGVRPLALPKALPKPAKRRAAR